MPARLRVAAITVSYTHRVEDDEGGRRLRERLEAAGATVTLQEIVRDDPEAIRAVVARVCDADLADAIVTMGGTGIAPRDRTYEAVEELLEKRLDGFGEAFRRLSWDEIGPRAVLSRAVAGVHRGLQDRCEDPIDGERDAPRTPGHPRDMTSAMVKRACSRCELLP